MSLPEIPGYRLIKRLGEGGMATVYLAIQENFQREIAIKIMSERLLADSNFGERFLREARIVAQLSHPNIVPVYDVGQHDNYHYIAMELLPGGDLKDLLQAGLSLPESISIVRQIATALQYASNKNFIHRDIKPDNILFREDGSAVVSDFGIARSTESETHMTLTGMIVGTPSYMSPEQAQGKPLDVRSDLYSLGIILFEMLAGHVPYTADSAISIGIKHISEPIPLLPYEFAALQPFVDRALAKEASSRFESAASFLSALNELEEKLKEGDGGTLVLKASELKRRAKAARKSSSTEPGVRRNSTQSKQRHSTQYESPGLQRHTKSIIALSVASAVLAGGTAFWMYEQDKTPPIVEYDEGLLDDSGQAGIALVKRGARAFEQGRLYEPANENAQYYYTSALTRAPTNVEAIEGIRELLATYLNEARSALEAGNGPAADEWLNRSSQIAFYAEDAKLLAQQQNLRADIFQQMQQRARQKDKASRISELLQQANDALANNRLMPPMNNNAYDNFQQVLRFDPENKLARAGIRSTAGRFLNNAQTAAVNKEFSEARSLLATAQQIDALHPDLKPTQERVLSLEQEDKQQAVIIAAQKADDEAAELREAQQREAELQAEQVRQQIAAANSSLQAGDFEEALVSFRQALSQAPLNEDALAGLRGIGVAYLASAKDLINNGRLDEADGALAKARALVPENQTLVELQKQVLERRERLAQEKDSQQIRAQNVNKLLAESREDIKQGRLFEPAANNALEKLSRIYAIDSNNQTAKSLRDQARLELADEIKQFLGQNDLASANKTFTALKKYYPKSQTVSGFAEEIAKLENKRQQLQQLLAESRKIAAQTRTSQSNEKLRVLYRKILKLRPNNAEALAGAERSNRFNIASIETALNEMAFDQAEEELRLLEKFAPRQADIIPLRSKLVDAIAANAEFQSLLSNASALYNNVDWSDPKNDGIDSLSSAHKSISEAKQIAPQSPQIADALQAIEARFIQGIDAYSNAQQFKEASKLHERAATLGLASNALALGNQRMDELKTEYEKSRMEMKKKATRNRGVF